MNYIVLDLEWNQDSDGQDEIRPLVFEIIEIGAVKLNERMEIVESFHELIRPQVFTRMHHITEQLIGIHMSELEGCRYFPEVAADFFAWCGEDYMFGTWGPMDLTELQRNMRYYGMPPLGKAPLRYYDIQKLFSLSFEDGRARRSLEYAVDYLKVEKDVPFHRAQSDAYYTARIFQTIREPAVLKRVSFDTYSLPQNRKEEIHIAFDNYEKYISRGFPDKEALLSDREVVSTKCYLCHKNLRKKIRWFSPNGRHYYSVSWCDTHGFLKGKIRVRKTDDEMVYAVKTMKFIPEAEVLRINQKKERAREQRREHRRRESGKNRGEE